ncbi:uncharacterized protein LOC143277970 isoform X2 [Babylonia areolata]|uniref:uncharacterized protein LOC143277970 isoform X2 n=1 Tax=Babylonia areolata TaxID=304850 RepID=UPI003FD0BA38
MAETTVRSKTKLGWAKSGMESSSDDEDAVIPGVNRTGSGNLRPRLRPRRRRDVGGSKASQSQTPAEDVPSTTTLSVQDLSQSLDERRLGRAGVGVQGGQVSLKDLCVEDKQRIANLIRELAKVGEEREKAREDLERERRSYEEQILKLVEQQEQILRERQEVEKHLQECQQLLAQSQPLHPPPPSLPAPPTNLRALHQPPPPFPPAPSSSYPPQWAWPGSGGQGAGQQGQELFQHSLLGNVGSPDRPTRSSSSSSHPQPHPVVSSVPVPDHGPPHHHHQHFPATQPPPPHHNHHHHHLYPVGGGGDLMSQQTGPSRPPLTHPHPHPHPPLSPSPPPPPPPPPPAPPHLNSDPDRHKAWPAVDFFTSAMQQPAPLDVFRTKDSAAPAPAPAPLSLPAHTSKEAVIERFFASQPAPAPPAANHHHHDDEEEERHLVSPKRRGPHRLSRLAGGGSGGAAFPRPVMSSTQKSAEIKDYLSVDSQHDFLPLVPDESSSTKSVNNGGEEGGAGGGGRRGEGGAHSRVVFSEGGGKGEPRLHSPVGDGGDEAHTYRRMSQTQRKEQLLQQRARLMEEQQRLRHILTEQEAMLHHKQVALQACSLRHHGDVNDENGGRAGDDVNGDDNDDDVVDDDPLGLVPQRLAIDAALERQRAIVNSLEAQHQVKVASSSRGGPGAGGGGGGRRQEEKGRGERKGRGGEEGRGGETFVVHCQQNLSDVVRRLDYSLHSDTEDQEDERENKGPGSASADDDYDDGYDDGYDDDRNENKENERPKEKEEEGRSPPPPAAASVAVGSRQDASTSVSYHTLPRSSQGGRGSVTVKAGSDGDPHLHPLSPPSHPDSSLHTRTPGEKTMSVLEIINSLRSPRPAHDGGLARKSPFAQELPPPGHHYRDLSPRWRENDDDDNDVEIVLMDSSEEEDVDDDDADDEKDVVANEDDLEESQILEDIFFLK